MVAGSKVTQPLVSFRFQVVAYRVEASLLLLRAVAFMVSGVGVRL